MLPGVYVPQPAENTPRATQVTLSDTDPSWTTLEASVYLPTVAWERAPCIQAAGEDSHYRKGACLAVLTPNQTDYGSGIL